MKCIRNSTREECAVKILRSNQNVQAEVDALQSCSGHPNIVRFIEAITDDAFTYIITEFLTGKDLFTHIKEQPSDECNTRKIFREIVLGLMHIHSEHFVHGDLKLENIRFSAENPAQSILKILDFGFAYKMTDKINVKAGLCYTLDYAAPEILSNEGIYTQSCDLWSLGKLKSCDEQIQFSSF